MQSIYSNVFEVAQKSRTDLQIQPPGQPSRSQVYTCRTGHYDFFLKSGLKMAELDPGSWIPVSAQGNQSPVSQEGLRQGWQKNCEMLKPY